MLGILQNPEEASFPRPCSPKSISIRSHDDSPSLSPLRAVIGFLHSLGDDRVASGPVCEGQLTQIQENVQCHKMEAGELQSSCHLRVLHSSWETSLPKIQDRAPGLRLNLSLCLAMRQELDKPLVGYCQLHWWGKVKKHSPWRNTLTA